MKEPLTKDLLFDLGVARIKSFCAQNQLPFPRIERWGSERWHFNACAYYRPVCINICLEKCAQVGRAGRSWSWPGYTVDRTPFGVLAHELGHHVDHHLSTQKGAYHGDLSINMRRVTQEPPLTMYCPNDAEWFAEHFRLFVTNPDLLRLLRPLTYTLLRANLTPVVDQTWQQVLEDAPPRTIAAAEKKVAAVHNLKQGKLL